MSSPSRSSSASSSRTVDDETSRPAPLDERLRADRLPGRDVLLDDAPEDVALPLGEQDRHAHHGRRRVRRAGERSRRRRGIGRAGSARASRSPSSASPMSGEPCELVGVERALEARERQRLVEPEAEHHPLRRADLGRQLLERSRWPLARAERREVAGERRCVAPAPVLDCADRAHAEAEVVVPEPVAEVVPRPQVAPGPARPGPPGRSSPSRTSGSRRRSASRRRARSTTPSTRPGAPARLRGRA